MTSGLEGVVAAETVLSEVNGESGRLIIRGVAVETLVATHRFEDVLSLLLTGFFDALPDRTALPARLGAARTQVFAHVQAIDDTLLSIAPAGALRALMARLPDASDIEAALQLIAAPAVLLPALLRLRANRAAMAPDPSLSQAADMLRMLTGELAGPAPVAGLDAYLVAVADHGLNASTFVSRIVASTGAGLASSVVAALGALIGPLHGGAPGPVLDMLDAIGAPEHAEGWLEKALDRGERLMGFGHRIYRVRDPRADALKGALRRLTVEGAPGNARLALAEAVEAAALASLRRARPGRVLETNVEFYTAILLEALGFPRDAFTGVFAAGRTAGWLAHAREQAVTGRLIRPASHYVGPAPLHAA
jgi:citrate synthase